MNKKINISAGEFLTTATLNNSSCSEKFYNSVGIKNRKLFFDKTNDLANFFLLRGIPTSILINKDGQEFARVVGSIDFQDKKLVEWLRYYD